MMPFAMMLGDPYPRLRVMPLSVAEYLPNGWRYGHSWCGMLIGNRTQAFKWYHFQWPWITSNLDFKVMELL